jgi:hypothetical protein
MTMQVELHPAVKEIAATLVYEDGKMHLSEESFAAHRERLAALEENEKEEVLVSLVAFSSRLLREGKNSANQPLRKLMELAGDLIGAKKAKAIFDNAGIKPKK